MEQIRGTGSNVIEAYVEDRYTSKESGIEYGIAIINFHRVAVMRYPGETFWYPEFGEVVR